MENIIKLFMEEKNNITMKEISMHNFVDPFVTLIVKKIEKECNLSSNSSLKESIIKNCKTEIFSYFPKILITESNIFHLENNLKTDNMNIFISNIFKKKESICKMTQIYHFMFYFIIKRCQYISHIYIDLLNKLKKDRAALIQNGLISESDELIKIDRELGDSHNKGNKVMELKFSTTNIFYKPKNSNLTKILFDIQRWVESQCSITFYRYNILNREDYSYEEKVEHKYVNSSLELDKYYYNFGVTLGLIYLLNGTDYHFENIISHGIYPVMIDNETLFNPALEGYQPDIHFLSLGMLPNSQNNIDFSALSGSLKSEKILVEQLVEKNKSFVLEKRDFFIKRRKNYPSENITYSYIYMQEKKHILLGFKDLLSVFIKNKQDFLNTDIIQKLKGEKIRIVLRHTMFYNELLTKLFHPYNIQTKETAQKFLRKYLQKNSKLQTIWECEEEHLLNGDIPIFHMDMEKNHLEEEKNYIVSDSTPIDAFINKINNIDAKKMLLSKNVVLNILNSNYKEF
ncbi:TPA: DUF4135 domain-containing protein [Staphylococcus aureus]|nr:DUF4135 domain-containing protein [Staphylococcus aureus]